MNEDKKNKTANISSKDVSASKTTKAGDKVQLSVKSAKLDRITTPQKNVKYGLVFESSLGSVFCDGKRYDSDNCSKEVPLQCDKRTMEVLEKTGHFKKVEIK